MHIHMYMHTCTCSSGNKTSPHCMQQECVTIGRKRKRQEPKEQQYIQQKKTFKKPAHKK